ncbi:P-loop containing nucleoside triphosphate hydrolase protein [Dacryopinax primogenitus]|uniref:RNA helicase n=1 Tax=Dacryopinax primogenitus (strain DJM 731) TaxID=1858805 RepID=M5G4F0_DACPD|nr:P-loop containing nucleoside triphosphate hydrolase protein [Dacryopinax primogenitus]EJU03110.1 P-loop containing nucleoside triphosphate hydrolase protein [Dacryopinax primogenitus]
MRNLRERYNAKARQSSKSGSHKKRRSHAVPDGPDKADANAELLLPVSKADKEAARAERLRLELSNGTKMSSKKKKRMDAWIAKKVAKDERVEILKKLEVQQREMDGLGLVSSSRLGSGRLNTWREVREVEEDRAVRKAMRGRREEGDDEDEDGDLDDPEDGEHEEGDERDSGVQEGDEEEEEWKGFSDLPEPASPLPDPPLPPPPAPPASTSAPVPAPTIGSALKRADGTITVPVVVKRTKRKKQKVREVTPESEFDSSDSGWDSSEGVDELPDEDGQEETGSDEEEDGEGEAGGEDEDSQSALPTGSVLGKRKRTGGFKDWANKQLDIAKGFDAVPAADTGDSTAAHEPGQQDAVDPSTLPHLAVVPRIPDPRPKPKLPSGPLGARLPPPSTPFAVALRSLPPNPHNHQALHRPVDVSSSRLLLPITAEEQTIVETVLLNPVTVICGETGSGKTTQLPGMLYEAGFGVPGSDNPGMIAVTQPRRVAAMSTASRVSHELALPPPVVAHAVRYDTTTSAETRIKFATDGVLLRELAGDFMLEKYSVVVVDEAHERTLGTDVLIGVLSRVVKLREKRFIEGTGKPLRLIIMSATLRISDFIANSVLFPTPPPLIHVPARQHPVTIHFSRRTAPDYVDEAIRKVERIHTRLQGGGVLVFLTGQREIELVCKRLEGRWGRREIEKRKKAGAARAGFSRKLDGQEEKVERKDEPVAVNARLGDVEPEEVDLGERGDGVDPAEDGDAVNDANSDDEYHVDDEEDDKKPSEKDSFDVPMHILPLYSLLPGDKQMCVFQDPPTDARLVVIATNVAETSLTIPGIRYVVDSGRSKERKYDLSSGIQSYQISWESKASAAQRAGRAGRTGPGHCYRLYSSAVFENHFEAFAQPEILRMPIEGVVLQMKSMNIDAVVNFPFPTPPDRLALRKAESLLVHLGALEPPSPAAKDGALSGRITEMGKAMALFPVAPRFAKMLVAGKQHGCLPYVIAIVAALSVGDPFLREEAAGKKGDGDEEEDDDDDMDVELANVKSGELRVKEQQKRRRKAFFDSQQAYAALGNGTSDIFRMLAAVGAFEHEGGTPQFCGMHFLRHKAMEEIRKLRSQITAIVRANFGNIINLFEPRFNPPTEVQLKALRQLLTAGFVDHVAVRKDIASPSSATGAKYSSCRGVPYRAIGVDEDVFVHPSSVVFHGPPPEYIIFLEMVRTSRVYVKTLTTINPAWLSILGRSMCIFSKPMQMPAAVSKKVAPATQDSRQVHVIPRFGPAAWELPAVLMTQKREGTRWVYVH